MTMGLLYWILMLLWLVGGGYFAYSGRAAGPFNAGFGGNVLLFILLLLLGWQAFGSPIQ